MKDTRRKVTDSKYVVGNKYSYIRRNQYAEFIVTDIRMPSLKKQTVYIYYAVVSGIILGSNSFMRQSDFDLNCQEI